MKPIHIDYTPLRDALQHVDLAVVPDDVAKRLYDCPPMQLVIEAVGRLHAAYSMARSGNDLTAHMAEVFADSAIEKVAFALHNLQREQRFHYDRETDIDPGFIDPPGVDGYPLGRPVTV